MPSSEPLFVYTGPRKLLAIFLVLFLGIFPILLLIAYVVQSQIAVDAFLVLGVLALIDFVFLLFTRDFEFHTEFLKIIDLAESKVIPYWQIEYRIISSNDIETMTSNNFIELKLRDSVEILRIKGNPLNQEIGMTLHDFLRKKTTPRIIIYYKL